MIHQDSNQSFDDPRQLVIFGMGTEFMCINKIKIGNVTHIYLREIRTGFGTNNVLWVDDELFQSPNQQELNQNQVFLHYIYHKCFEKNVNMILKNSSDLAWAYIRSDFFKISLRESQSFKLVTDVTRWNEAGTDEDKYNAGPNLIKKFKEHTRNFPGINKVEFMVFCGNQVEAQKKFLKIGFKQNEIPQMTQLPI